MQEIQGDHSQMKNLRVNLTFLVKILSDFTELPIARKIILLVLCFLSNCVCICVPVCECTCMHVCLHMFPGMHRNRSDCKGKEGSVGH